MKSLAKLAESVLAKKDKKMNKRGILGLDSVRDFMLIILTVAVIAFAIIIALANLNSSGVLVAGSTEKNQTTTLFNNVTAGVTSFFSNSTTFFSLLAVAVIILIIGLVIFAVNRFSAAGAAPSAGL